MTTNVFWPAWEWGPGGKPGTRYVSASYSEALTVRDNRRTRSLIKHPWYQERWGNDFQIVGDQDAKLRFDNDKKGFKIATSVGGLGTGERGDRFIIDDPHNVIEGESEVKRDNVIQWFTEVVPTRVNDPATSSIIVIMQRVHERDVSGVILSRELGYEHLMLPMEYEPSRSCYTSVGFEDPRLKENELLWPDRMTRSVVERDKAVMGSYAVAGQFQQRPSPRGGGMFQRKWFEIVDRAPEGGIVWRGWDLAASEDQGSDWTAGVRVRRVTENGVYTFYIEHAVRKRLSPGKTEKLLSDTAELDGPRVRISIPQDPAQAGKAQKRYLASRLVGYIVKFSLETGAKETRAEPLASQAEAGNVKVVRGPWNDTFFEELEVFPTSEFKDQVDACARAFNEMIPSHRKRLPTGAHAIELSNVS